MKTTYLAKSKIDFGIGKDGTSIDTFNAYSHDQLQPRL